MQTILGAGGAIGIELAKALPKYTTDIRLVSRNPQKVNENDELISADLLNKQAVMDTVKNSSVAYVTIGLPYDIKTWKKQWPVIMQNIISACKEHTCKLVFFDNIYMIDKNHIGNITEESPINPSSKKGKVRAELNRMILNEVEKGNLDAIIARAADFYGPKVNTSVLQETVFKNFKRGKAANWFCSLDRLHNFTYTPDAGIATAMLGNDPKAYNQIWNLPTAEPMTGREWIEAFAREMNVKPKIQLAPKWMIKIMGWFNPIMREFVEMLYQYDRDYVFNSSKFEESYDFKPTPIEKGIREVVKAGL